MSLRYTLLALAAAAVLTPVTAALADHHEGGPAPSAAEAAMMEAMQRAAAVNAPHRRLAEMAGTYEATMQSWGDPSAPPMESTMQVRREMTMGGRVLEEHWTGQIMGMDFHGMGRTGYDNVTGRYWSTWTDNTSTGLFVSYGDWNEEKGMFEFNGDAIDPVSGGKIPSRMISTFPDENSETMTMFQEMGGKEIKTMAAKIVRTR
ncbi:MAG: DUF1579 family protein [Pseudomonadota bacterium]